MKKHTNGRQIMIILFIVMNFYNFDLADQNLLD